MRHTRLGQGSSGDRPPRGVGLGAACGAAVLALTCAACAGASSRAPADRQYDLTGHVLAADPARRELTIAHDDIPGYMPAMAMPFRVDDSAAWPAVEVGDLVRGRLVVREEDGFLTALERTGHRALPVPVATTADYLLEGDLVPDVRFVDQEGRERRLRQDSGAAVVATFIYTRCPFPTFCPLMDRQFRVLAGRIAADARLAGRVRLYSITLDPEYDTVPILASHAARVGADGAAWTFVRPHDAPAAELAARFGVVSARDAPGSALIVHTLATVVIDPAGRVAEIVRGGAWTADDLAAILHEAVGARAGAGS